MTIYTLGGIVKIVPAATNSNKKSKHRKSQLSTSKPSTANISTYNPPSTSSKLSNPHKLSRSQKEKKRKNNGYNTVTTDQDQSLIAEPLGLEQLITHAEINKQDAKNEMLRINKV